MRYPGVSDEQRSVVSEPVAARAGDEIANAESNARATHAVRVLIVDDHTLIREGLRQLLTLEDGITVIGEAVDGIEAISRVRRLQPDVVLMDIHMPMRDGIAVTRQITQEFPKIAVIMLTMHQQNQQVVEAMRNGAKGYLLKSAAASEVAQAIRMVSAGEVAIAPELMGALVNEVRRGGGTPTPSTAPTGLPNISALTEKEIEIIRYLASGMSNKEIATRLAYSEKTVKNYLSVIYQKLNLRDRTQVAIFALRHGLLPDEDFVY